MRTQPTGQVHRLAYKPNSPHSSTMYKEHPRFTKPADENVAIWRYLDFTKFVSLLDKQGLYFSRADRLPDQLEGSLSEANIERRKDAYETLSRDLPKQVADAVRGIAQLHQAMTRVILVNSWHINEHESAAMWKLYLKTDEGVAIRSTFKRLTQSFNTSEPDVFVGVVDYLDYVTDFIPEDNALAPFLCKRKSFEHERELRALVWTLLKDFTIPYTNESLDDGIPVSVDLDVLVDKIFVSPTAQPWFSELVRSVTQKYGLNKEVTQSNLSKGPLY